MPKNDFSLAQVDVDSRTMILSERAAIMEDAMGTLKAGDVVEATVRNLVPYGAFVSIKNPQSGELTGGHVRTLLLYMICQFRSLCINAVEACSLAFTIVAHSRHYLCRDISTCCTAPVLIVSPALAILHTCAACTNSTAAATRWRCEDERYSRV